MLRANHTAKAASPEVAFVILHKMQTQETKRLGGSDGASAKGGPGFAWLRFASVLRTKPLQSLARLRTKAFLLSLIIHALFVSTQGNAQHRRAVTSDSDLIKIMNITYDATPFDQRQAIVRGDSVFISIVSNENSYSAKFVDVYFQLLIYDLKPILRDVSLINMKLSTQNASAGSYEANYRRGTIDTVLTNFKYFFWFPGIVRYSIHFLTTDQIKDVNTTLNLLYSKTGDSKYDIHFRDLLWEYGKAESVNKENSVPREVLTDLVKFYKDVDMNSTMAVRLNHFLTMCGYKPY